MCGLTDYTYAAGRAGPCTVVVVVRDGQTEQFVGLSFFHAFYGAALRNSLFPLPCFTPPFSRHANVTAQAGRQAGRRRICLVLSVPMPRVKRKLSHTHTHTMRHSHNLTLTTRHDPRTNESQGMIMSSVGLGAPSGGERRTGVSPARVF